MNNAELYNKLFESGYIDVNSTNYVWLPEMEFLTPEDMKYRKNLYNEYYYVDDLTVFAINGAGDFLA